MLTGEQGLQEEKERKCWYVYPWPGKYAIIISFSKVAKFREVLGKICQTSVMDLTHMFIWCLVCFNVDFLAWYFFCKKKCKNHTHKLCIMCEPWRRKTVKVVKMHKFLVCAYKSQDMAQSHENFARLHDRETVTFRNYL